MISFIIITNGKNPKKLDLQIQSIFNLCIPDYEIIIAGRSKFSKALCSGGWINAKVKFVEDLYSADNGFLGGLRNSACKEAKGDYLVISDDDMLFTKKWFQNFNIRADIVTPCVKLPDGTRFWDNCCYGSPTNNQKILNPYEFDDHLYMSGGQSWVMKREVWDKVKWDDTIAIYSDRSGGKYNEDIDYSIRCREAGFKINHNHLMIVYHNDKTYTSLGRAVFQRGGKRGPEWTLSFNFTEANLYALADQLQYRRLVTEDIDIFRRLNCKEALDQIEYQLGGPLANSQFTYDNKEYFDLIND